MRVLVCGGRHFEDAERVRHQLACLHGRKPITVLIHGSVTGAGVAAEIWARRNGIALVRYPPNWEFYGKKAEGLRNTFMIEDSRPDLVVAFPGGRHTTDLVQRAIAANVAVLVIPAEYVDDASIEMERNEEGPPADSDGADTDPARCIGAIAGMSELSLASPSKF